MDARTGGRTCSGFVRKGEAEAQSSSSREASSALRACDGRIVPGWSEGRRDGQCDGGSAAEAATASSKAASGRAPSAAAASHHDAGESSASLAHVAPDSDADVSAATASAATEGHGTPAAAASEGPTLWLAVSGRAGGAAPNPGDALAAADDSVEPSIAETTAETAAETAAALAPTAVGVLPAEREGGSSRDDTDRVPSCRRRLLRLAVGVPDGGRTTAPPPSPPDNDLGICSGARPDPAVCGVVGSALDGGTGEPSRMSAGRGLLWLARRPLALGKPERDTPPTSTAGSAGLARAACPA